MDKYTRAMILFGMAYFSSQNSCPLSKDELFALYDLMTELSYAEKCKIEVCYPTIFRYFQEEGVI